MSEYQYYEFVALDAPVPDRTLRWLRTLSTRAEITPTRFVNTYQWGNFKGDPVEMLVRAYDAHVYVSNMGYCRFMLKLPATAADLRGFGDYCVGAGPCMLRKRPCILDFAWEDDDGTAERDDDGSGWLGGLVPIRDALMSGDRRALYLAWLANVRSHALADSAREPTVPPGLHDLSAPLRALAAFLQIPPRLIEIAASASPPSARAPSVRSLATWVRGWPSRARDGALVSLLADDSPRTRRNLLRRLTAENTRTTPPRTRRRTIGEMRAAIAPTK